MRTCSSSPACMLAAGVAGAGSLAGSSAGTAPAGRRRWRRGPAWRPRCRGGGYGGPSPPAVPRRRRSSLSGCASAFELRQDLPAHGVVDAGADERRRRPADGAPARPRSSGETGHLPSSVSRSATSRRSAGALGRAPPDGVASLRGGLAHVADAPPHQLANAASRARGARPISAPRSGSSTTSGEADRTSISSSTDWTAFSPSGTALRTVVEHPVGGGRARGPIGRGGSCQIGGHQRRRRAPGAGRPPASCSRSAGSSAAPASWASATSAAAGQRVPPISRTTSPAIMLWPSARLRSRLQGRGGQRLCHLLDQSRQLAAREAAPARPGLGLVNQQVLERQDQDAAQRDRAGRPQQGQPAAHGRQQPVDRPAPVERVDQADDLQQLLVAGAGHVAVETRDRSGRAHAVAARSSSARARLSITLSAGAPVLVQLDPAAAVEADVVAVEAGRGLAVVRVEHRQRRPDLLQRLALQRPLVPRDRLPQAADLTPAVEQPLRPGQRAAHPLADPLLPAAQQAQHLAQQLARLRLAPRRPPARPARRRRGRRPHRRPCRRSRPPTIARATARSVLQPRQHRLVARRHRRPIGGPTGVATSPMASIRSNRPSTGMPSRGATLAR